jgi:hypothetical protein
MRGALRKIGTDVIPQAKTNKKAAGIFRIRVGYSTRRRSPEWWCQSLCVIVFKTMIFRDATNDGFHAR